MLRVCVETDDSVAVEEEQVYVRDILTFEVTRDGTPSSTVIFETETDLLTSKICSNTICSIQTQLLSKFFVASKPADLHVDGVVFLVFGIPVRHLVPVAVPITTRSLRTNTRQLQDDGVQVSSFNLTVPVSTSSNSNADDSESDVAMTLIIIVPAAGCDAGPILIVFAIRKSSKDATSTIMKVEEQHQSTMECTFS